MKKGILDAAENLLRLGVSPDIVSEATGLSMDALNEIKLQLEKS
ncbi:hypothetical protein [uncultured Phocaeicola sp.]|nr:hypothetical protein [uncultured Phocaeicola sp.]